MEGAISSGLLKTLDRSIHSLSGSGEGTAGQHLDSLGLSDFSTGVDDFLSNFLELPSEVSELQHFSFDEGIPQLLYSSVDDGLVWLSVFEDVLTEGVKGGLRTVTRSCA